MRICGVRRDVRFLVVVLLVLLRGGEEEEEEEDEGEKVGAEKRSCGFDWRWGVGKSS